MRQNQICTLEEAFDCHIFKGKQVGKTPENMKEAGSAWSEAVWQEATRFGPKHFNETYIADGIAFCTRAIFLCGVHRSGTTLLRNLLDDHDALSVLPSEGSFFTQLEPKLMRMEKSKWSEFLCREWLWRLVTGDHQPPFWLLGRSTEDSSPYVDFAIAFLSWWPIVEKKFSKSMTIWPMLVLQLAFEDMQPKIVSGKFKKYWVDKTPLNEMYLNRLWKELPEAKVVYIARNPDAIINSRKKMEWFTGTPVKVFIRQLRMSLKIAIKEWKRFNPRFLLIKYEDLIAEPVLTMHTVANFLEIDYLEKLLIPSVVGILTKSNSSFDEKESVGQIHVQKLTQKSMGVTKHELEQLHASVSSYANELGYSFAKDAFNKQSFVFDELYANNKIVAYKRERTRDALERQLKNGARILELNAGTGQDALYFVNKGFSVHATDISNNMLDELRRKIEVQYEENVKSDERCMRNLHEKTRTTPSYPISLENISFEDLEMLTDKGPYDAIFSNFGGLNCTKHLDKVLENFSGLLNTNGVVTLVVMPGFCLWEFLLVFRGEFKTAFRRIFSKNGAKAHIEGVHFLCYYYSPQYIINQLKDDFELVQLEGLCSMVPPSYIENFPNKFPKVFKYLKKWENNWKRFYPFNRIGDYYIISLKKVKREGVIYAKEN